MLKLFGVGRAEIGVLEFFGMVGLDALLASEILVQLGADERTLLEHTLGIFPEPPCDHDDGAEKRGRADPQEE